MTTTTITTPTLTTSPARPRLVRAGALALILAGPLGLAIHALWRIGHGPTVINEHGVVLGLTNDQWAHFGNLWLLLLGSGVVAACSVHRGRLNRVGRDLTLVGLVVYGLAGYVWPLYAAGLLLLNAGVLCLALTFLQDRRLPRAAGFGLLATFAAFLPLPLTGDLVYATVATGPVPLQVQDLLALLTAAGWTCVGWALTRVGQAPAATR